MWRQNNKWHIIVPLLVIAVLAGAFWYGGSSPGLQGWTVSDNNKTEQPAAPADTTPEADEQPNETAAPGDTDEPTPGDAALADGQTEQTPPAVPVGAGELSADAKVALAQEIAGQATAAAPQGDAAYSAAQGMEIDPETGKDKYNTDPVPDGKPLPVEPQDAAISDVAHTCTISISCANILDHMDWLDSAKIDLVPADGWILPPLEVTFYEGESVFNVLQRTCKQQGIHLEFMNTPMYNSAYIEGINNLYEFDCGELSGWMYKVNDWAPNYGCSRYQLQAGDVICWEYTCDLGRDVNGYTITGA